ncbi:hypothetical protein RhiirA4_479242 [Rhizophagus irregularis]|uniref:Uncharacterized protein n=1 Tax=Rhizophagus irregularis TaxID=588596 RepID=A0A2I1HG63_9GLOM|nr:hypothetical protein RhiirA4_479242 [Rhizophagus irregularis]
MFKEHQNIYENKEKYKRVKIKNDNKRIGIYIYIIHKNKGYHCMLFEDKNIKFILPFEEEIEDILINGGRKI